MKKSTRNNKKIWTFVVVMFLIFIAQMATPAFSESNEIPPYTLDFYVNDFAEILSEDNKSELLNKAIELADYYDGVQVVVTTVETTSGDDISDYALRMYNQWKIGRNDMGILILLATEDRQIWVATGDAMEYYFPESKVGRYIDKYAIPDLKSNNFPAGIVKLQKEFINEVKTLIDKEREATSEHAETVSIIPNTQNEHQKKSSPVGMIMAIIALIGGLISTSIFSILNSKKRRDAEAEKEKLADKYDNEVNSNHILKQKLDSQRTNVAVLTREKETLSSNLADLTSKHRILKERYERAVKLYPMLDKEIDAQIVEEKKQYDIEQATNVDFQITSALQRDASRENIWTFSTAFNAYQRLTEAQKSYVKGDWRKVKALLDQSQHLGDEYQKNQKMLRDKKSAKDITSNIERLIGGLSGTAGNLSRIQEAKNLYNRVDSDVKKYMDSKLEYKVMRLYDEARRDKRQKEEEEERRRRMMNSSSSSYSSSHHHSSSSHSSRSIGGLGGHSSGGGAGRRF